MPSGEKGVNVFVSNSSEGRVKLVVFIGSNFLEHSRQLLRNLLCAQFYQPEA